MPTLGDIHQDHHTIAGGGPARVQAHDDPRLRDPVEPVQLRRSSPYVYARGAPSRRPRWPRSTATGRSSTATTRTRNTSATSLARTASRSAGRSPSASKSCGGSCDPASPAGAPDSDGRAGSGAADTVAAARTGSESSPLIGTDMSHAAAAGASCATHFHVVQTRSSDEFAPALAELAVREGADVVFPQSSGEVDAVRGQPRALPDAAAGRPRPRRSRPATTSLNDGRWPRRPGSRFPPPAWPRRRTSLGPGRGARLPRLDVCMKPPQSKGSRGFRVLSANVDRRHALLEARPGPLPLSVEEALEAIGDDVSRRCS